MIKYPIKLYSKQKLFLDCLSDNSISEILLDGSKGSGKTASVVLGVYFLGMNYKKLHIGLFRRTLSEVKETLLRYSLENYPKGTYKHQISNRRLLFTTNSRCSLNFAEQDKDLMNYQGWSFNALIIDESTTFTEYQISMLKSQLRSVTNFTPKLILSTNPIGISHGFHKKRFIENKEPFKKYETPESSEYRKKKNLPESHARYLIRIPMQVEDNLELMKNNPQYIATLDALPERERAALRHGSWDIKSGLYFNNWDESIHVINNYTPTLKDNLFISCDWGTSKPFAIGWYALTPEEHIIMYREYYGIRGNIPDSGLNLTAEEVATKIIELTPPSESIKYMVLDSECWADRGHGASIKEIMQDILKSRSIFIIKSPKDRINGLENIRKYLTIDPITNTPFLQITKNCENLIRTLPYAPFDKNKDLDIDTRYEDHAIDQLSYLLLTRPFPKRIQESIDAPYMSRNWFKNKQKEQKSKFK